MPTTSNFGWTTPADTDLVKDGASAIRTLGNGIDSSFIDLKGGTTGQVLSKASNTDLDFTWVAQDDSNAIQNALLTTTGDTIYASSASTPARLGIGTTGQVLTVSGGVPVWATPANGKIRQVVQGTYATEVSSSSSTYADTNLSATITPSATASKILVMFAMSGGKDSGNSANQAQYAIVRGSTVVWATGGGNYTGTALTLYSMFNGVYLDSPSTTSATTYKIQFKNNQGNFGNVYANGGNATSTLILMEVGA